MSRADLTAIDGDFDPAAVPMYPMLRAEIRLVDGGYVGLVDDKVVLTSADMVPVRDAIITTAARTAARRLGALKAIRVTGQAPDGGVFRMVVTAAGDVHDTTNVAAEARDDETASRKKKTRKGPLPTPDLKQDKKDRPHPLLLVIVGFPLVMVGFAAYMLLFRGESIEQSVSAPDARQLPVVAPAGYKSVARWAVDVGTATGTTGGGVAVDAERVYAATDSGDHITAYATDNGVRRWSTDLGSPVTTGPAILPVDGKTAVVVATSSKLLLLDPKTGEETGEWEFDPEIGSQVHLTATGPVVTGQSTLAQIIVDGELTRRIMPAGTQPVGPGPEGSLIAASGDRVYSSTSGSISGAGEPVKPATKGTVTAAGWTGTRLVLAYTSASGNSSGTKLAAYSAPTALDGAWPREWVTPLIPSTSAVPAGSSGQQLPLVTGPGGDWGIYGTTAVDLDSGKTADLGQWTTVTVGDQIAFGTGSEQVLSAGPSGLGGRSATGTTGSQMAAPQAVWGSSAYLVTTGGGTRAWLYALEVAENTASSPSPSGDQR